MIVNRFRPNLEVLELRDTPSAGTLMPNGTLLINGTNQADTILVSPTAGNPGQVTVNITTGGVLSTENFDLAQVKRLRINGGAGNDTITNDTAIPAVIVGGAGNDTITGGSSRNIIIGGPGNDHIYGGAGNDIIFGGKGNDVFVAGTGHELIFGGEGADKFIGGTSHDIFYSGKVTDKELKRVLDHDHDGAKDHDYDWSFHRIDTLLDRLQRHEKHEMKE